MQDKIAIIVWGFLLLAGLGVLFFPPGTPKSEPYNGIYPKHCVAFANELFAERLSEAIANPSLWKLVGDNSAEEYAERSRRFYLGECK